MTMKVEYTSPSDREGLVVSLLWDSEQWAEVKGKAASSRSALRPALRPTVDLRPRRVTAALLEAKRRLADVVSA
jgi:hypothetical protein